MTYAGHWSTARYDDKCKHNIFTLYKQNLQFQRGTQSYHGNAQFVLRKMQSSRGKHAACQTKMFTHKCLQRNLMFIRKPQSVKHSYLDVYLFLCNVCGKICERHYIPLLNSIWVTPVTVQIDAYFNQYDRNSYSHIFRKNFECLAFFYTDIWRNNPFSV